MQKMVLIYAFLNRHAAEKRALIGVLTAYAPSLHKLATLSISRIELFSSLLARPPRGLPTGLGPRIFGKVPLHLAPRLDLG